MSATATVTNDVYRKIKEISSRSMNPRPKIQVQMIAEEMAMPVDMLMHTLRELKDLRLINNEGMEFRIVNLTLLGCTVNR
jgi:hypothetical protein